MAESQPGNSTDTDIPLSQMFDKAMKSFQKIEADSAPTCDEAVQLSIKTTITLLERVTKLVSASGMFSSNENVEELPTETLQYLLLPVLLGTLHLKVTTQAQTRKEIIEVAEIYFRDFLQRCNDYNIISVDIPPPEQPDSGSSIALSEQAKIANMVSSREAKIKRYKAEKELKAKLETMSYAMTSPNVDDDTRREYFTTLLQSYAQRAVEELYSIQQEKPILEYMSKHADEGALRKPAHRPPPLKPVIITRDAVQKAVYGLGYPALPTLTIEEFYDQRVREGTFPGACSIPNTTIQSTELNPEEAEEIHKENLVESEDPEERARQMNMDEYKDDHRRGWGNRHNRS